MYYIKQKPHDMLINRYYLNFFSHDWYSQLNRDESFPRSCAHIIIFYLLGPIDTNNSKDSKHIGDF